MNHISRRAILGAGLAAPGIVQAGSAHAQAWPSGPIRIIVPFAAGGSTDAVARLASPGLTQRLGVPIVVENRSGAAGSLGTHAVAQARPDGNTWLLTFDSHATLPALLPNLPFNLTRDLDPVLLIGGAPYVIATRPDKPYRTLADVIAAARARPDAVTYGSTGNLQLSDMNGDQIGGPLSWWLRLYWSGIALAMAVVGLLHDGTSKAMASIILVCAAISALVLVLKGQAQSRLAASSAALNPDSEN
jgi:tripartite-type tricarboxylate transporter receptor subunit TctC